MRRDPGHLDQGPQSNRPKDLDAPTPCASWDVRTLVNHFIGTARWWAATIAGDDDVAHADYTAGDFVTPMTRRCAKLGYNLQIHMEAYRVVCVRLWFQSQQNTKNRSRAGG
jgi:hypothetical protein